MDYTLGLESLLALASSILVAIITAYVTVRLSLHRFRDERLWERKFTSYEELLGALHDLKRYSEAYVEAEEEGHEFSKVEPELAAKRKAARSAVFKSIDTGELVLAPQAVESLSSLAVALDKALRLRSFYEMASAEVEALNRALVEVRAIARDDLWSL